MITPSGDYYITLSYFSRYSNTKTVYSGIYYSQDGTSWQNISPENLQPNYRIVMDYAASDENILYFFSSNVKQLSTGCQPNSEGCVSIFKLNKIDSDFIWQDLSASIPDFETKHPYVGMDSQWGYAMDIKISPIDTNIVIIGTTNCYISYNGFANQDSCLWIGGFNPDFDPAIWNDPTTTYQEKYANALKMMHPNSGRDYHSFTFHPENHIELISTSDHGIHRLKDVSIDAPKDWDDLNNGYTTTQFYDCAINKKEAGNDYIIGGMQDNGTYANFLNPLSFNKYWTGDGFSSYITSDNNIVLSDQNFVLKLDLKNGMPVNGALINLPNINNNEYGLQFNTEFAVNPYNEKELVVATAKVIAFCTDINSDTAWKNYEYHFIDDLDATHVCYLAPTHNGVIVGTPHKKMIKVNELEKENFSYEVINLPEFVTGSFVSDVWTDPQNVDHFIAIISNYLSLGMLETYDNGETWTDHGGNLEEFPSGLGVGPSFRCYEKIVYEGDTLHLLGTSEGLFSSKSLDGKNTKWLREGSQSIGKNVIEDIEFRALDGRIVIATHGNGLFMTNYATSINNFNASNLGFAVSEIYPTPATDKINFTINSDYSSKIEVKILDINGSEVTTIISESFKGTKNIDFDISNLPSAMYLIHISNGINYITKKFNVAK